MEKIHCCHLGFPIDTILVRFAPEVILLLQSNVRFKSSKRFGKRCRKLIFQDAAVEAFLDFLSIHLAILCLLGVLMFIIKFQFIWIIEEMSKI